MRFRRICQTFYQKINLWDLEGFINLLISEMNTPPKFKEWSAHELDFNSLWDYNPTFH